MRIALGLLISLDFTSNKKRQTWHWTPGLSLIPIISRQLRKKQQWWHGPTLNLRSQSSAHQMLGNFITEQFTHMQQFIQVVKIFSSKKMNRFDSGSILCLHMELWSNSLRRSGIAQQILAQIQMIPFDLYRSCSYYILSLNNDWTLTAILLFKEKRKFQITIC